MIPFRNIRMDLMSSKEVAKYLKRNDAVILPLGCFEMHGPRVPLACDSFNDWVGSLLLGERWNCLVMPPVTYTFPGASGPWPGTVDISHEITIAYVKEIALALLRNGFGRVILCSSHAPNIGAMTIVSSSIFHETGNVVMAISPHRLLRPADLVEKEFKGRFRDVVREDVFLLGSLKLLGLHGAFDPTMGKDRPAEFPLPAIRKFAPYVGSGCVPWIFVADHQHTGLRKGVTLDDADRALRVMRTAAKRLPDLPKFFAEYQRQVARAMKDKPWTKENIWTA
mgnify:CR=1 FL=1